MLVLQRVQREEYCISIFLRVQSEKYVGIHNREEQGIYVVIEQKQDMLAFLIKRAERGICWYS
jgi:hypothetical protein